MRLIQASPERYPLQKNGARRFVMPRFPFIVHYVELPKTNLILAFAHTSRKPGYWLSRAMRLFLFPGLPLAARGSSGSSQTNAMSSPDHRCKRHCWNRKEGRIEKTVTTDFDDRQPR